VRVELGLDLGVRDAMKAAARILAPRVHGPERRGGGTGRAFPPLCGPHPARNAERQRLMSQHADEEGRPRILLIEDSQEIREVLTEELSREGYEVVSTASGLEGLVRFARERFDLVLLDLQIEELSGLGVERAIRDLAEAPVVVMSAREKRWQAEAFRAGAAACVRKPFDLEDLLSLLRTLLARAPAPPEWTGEVSSLSHDDLDRLRRMSPEELDSLPFGVITVDASLRIAQFNSYEQAASGLPPAGVIGKPVQEIAPCIDVQAFIGTLEEGARRSHPDKPDKVMRFVFPHRSALSVVSVRLYQDPDHDRVFVFISRRYPRSTAA
jgi:photoactive yellow protein